MNSTPTQFESIVATLVAELRDARADAAEAATAQGAAGKEEASLRAALRELEEAAARLGTAAADDSDSADADVVEERRRTAAVRARIAGVIQRSPRHTASWRHGALAAALLDDLRREAASAGADLRAELAAELRDLRAGLCRSVSAARGIEKQRAQRQQRLAEEAATQVAELRLQLKAEQEERLSAQARPAGKMEERDAAHGCKIVEEELSRFRRRLSAAQQREERHRRVRADAGRSAREAVRQAAAMERRELKSTLEYDTVVADVEQRARASRTPSPLGVGDPALRRCLCRNTMLRNELQSVQRQQRDVAERMEGGTESRLFAALHSGPPNITAMSP